MTSSLFSPGGLPVPALSDEPNVPADLAELTDTLDPSIIARFTSTIERDETWGAAIAPVGARCFITGTRRWYVVWLNDSLAAAWYPLTADGLISVVNNAARDALLEVEGLGVFVTSTGATYRYTTGAWVGTSAFASGAFSINTTKVATNTVLANITVPAASVPTRITFTAIGRGGFDTVARDFNWAADNFPGSATNLVLADGDSSQNTAGAAEFVAVTTSVTYDLPAGVAATLRLTLHSTGPVYNRGAVTWVRVPI